MKKHRKIIAIQGDPLNSLNRKTDTTLLLALEAQKRGYKIYYYETKNLTFSNGKIFSLCKEVVFFEKKKKFYSIKNFKTIDLSKVNFILMRQNPPFNMDYITATFLLEKISKKTCIINDPASVRNMPEKLQSMANKPENRYANKYGTLKYKGHNNMAGKSKAIWKHTNHISNQDKHKNSKYKWKIFSSLFANCIA